MNIMCVWYTTYIDKFESKFSIWDDSQSTTVINSILATSLTQNVFSSLSSLLLLLSLSPCFGVLSQTLTAIPLTSFTLLQSDESLFTHFSAWQNFCRQFQRHPPRKIHIQYFIGTYSHTHSHCRVAYVCVGDFFSLFVFRPMGEAEELSGVWVLYSNPSSWFLSSFFLPLLCFISFTRTHKSTHVNWRYY